MQRERHAPDHPPKQLAAHHARIDDPSCSECANETGNAHLSEIGIDLDLGEYSPMRMHGVTRLCRFTGCTLSSAVDFREPGTAKDIRVTLATALVVTSEQATPARNHAGIAGAEQRRTLVVGREIGQPTDHVGAGVVYRHAGSRSVSRAARDTGIGKV